MTKVNISINSRQYEHEVEDRMLLVHFIREKARLTGTHIGCDSSNCGACTVLLDGQAVKSCTLLAVQANGAKCQHSRRAVWLVQWPEPRPRGIPTRTWPAMRLLHTWDADGLHCTPGRKFPTV